MDLFASVPDKLYLPLFMISMIVLSILTSLRYANSDGDEVLTDKKIMPAVTILISLLLVYFLGNRPHTYFYFGDTFYYYHSFTMIDEYILPALGTEWLWNNLNFVFKQLGDDGSFFFLFVEFGYIGFMLLACFRLAKNNIWVAFLFCVASFSFYGYAVNGMRNGLACSIMMYAIALISGNRYEILFSILLMAIAYSIHNSVALPAICAVMSLLLFKNLKYALIFWSVSIVISLLVGNSIGELFASMGFDDRTSYFEDVAESEFAGQFSSTGFRFDFLLYSAMPVLFVWYLTIKRNFKDKTYNIIANTYILANAFWIMVIRATYSNRFAYLSWFLYPIVIVYPLLRMKIWEDQDRKLALILLAYSGFTFVMFLLGK